jgi:RraA family protein
MKFCRVYRPGVRIDSGLVERFEKLSAAVVSDCLERTNALHGLRPLAGTRLDKSLAGTALTVWTRPGDGLVVHKAIELAKEGDVLVIDGGGSLERAVIGEIMAKRAHARGIRGVVIGGAVRDARSIADGPMPVFAAGTTVLGSYTSGPGEIHRPVSIGGTVVRDGDLIVGDYDGLVVVPYERASATAACAEAKAHEEKQKTAEIGETGPGRSLLDELRVEYVDTYGM